MRDDVILDAIVYLACDNAAIDQVIFAAIGPIANNALGPSVRYARHLHELIQTCCIDIDARVRRGKCVRIALGRRRSICETCEAGRKCTTERDDEDSNGYPHSHMSILRHRCAKRKSSIAIPLKVGDWSAGFLQKWMHGSSPDCSDCFIASPYIAQQDSQQHQAGDSSRSAGGSRRVPGVCLVDARRDGEFLLSKPGYPGPHRRR
jgi:hypothetical protein